MKKILAILVIIILGFVAYSSYSWSKNIKDKIFVAKNKTQASLPTIADNLKSQTPFNILLLGYGGGKHDGAYLTDTIIVTHIDPKLKKVTLISIPRDIWVKIPTDKTEGSYWKINAAYTLGLNDQAYPNKEEQFKGTNGGGRLAEYMSELVTGLPINNFIGGDFAGFVKTIDTLGGVDINIDIAFEDDVYPIFGKENELCDVSPDAVASYSAQIATDSAQIEDFFPCRFEKLSFPKGLQRMDGETALKYVRSRHSLQDGTDFGRSKRQLNLILAVKKQVLSIGFIPKILPFISSLQDDFRTDLSLNDVQTLITNANSLSKYTIQSIAITDQNLLSYSFTPDGQSVLIPKSGLDNWSGIHNWITSYINPNYLVKDPQILVENATGIGGLAKKITDKLKNEKYIVLDPLTAAKQTTQTTITVFDRKIDPQLLTTLQREFAVYSIQHRSSTNQDYDILITLGKDYNF
jgi:polyisoprenyl-teichoic acid--peptidoglycan teichoic acid transferase